MAQAAASSGRYSPAQTERRQEILDVALDLFSQQGYEGTSLREVAERLGFSVAALYYHFKAKEELLSLLVEPYAAELERIITTAETEGPLTARAGRSVLDRYLDLLLTNRRLTSFLERDLAVQERLEGRRVDKLTERLRSVLAGPDPKPTDLVRASAALGALRRPVLRLAELDLNAMRKQLLDQAMKLLYPRARGGGASAKDRGTGR